MDFEKIKQLEDEIKDILEKNPQYKEWFYNIRKEIDRQAGKDKTNRSAVAVDIMMEEWLKIIPANNGEKND